MLLAKLWSGIGTDMGFFHLYISIFGQCYIYLELKKKFTFFLNVKPTSNILCGMKSQLIIILNFSFDFFYASQCNDVKRYKPLTTWVFLQLAAQFTFHTYSDWFGIHGSEHVPYYCLLIKSYKHCLVNIQVNTMADVCYSSN